MALKSTITETKSKLQDAFAPIRSYAIAILLFSSFINILQLTGSIFMLQVYDRVIPSKSVETLIGLIVLMGSMYVFLGVLDMLRSRVLMRFGARIDTGKIVVNLHQNNIIANTLLSFKLKVNKWFLYHLKLITSTKTAV